MTVDRSRITKLINAAKRVDAVTLNPSDSDQSRQTVIRKMITAERVNDFETPGVMRLASERFD